MSATELKQTFLRGRDDEILQVKRFEVSDILRTAFVERLLGQPRKTAGRRGHLDELGAGKHLGAFAGAAAENHERTALLPEFPEAAGIDHLGRNLVLRTALRIEDLRINLHAAGIDHRAEQRTAQSETERIPAS